MPEKTNAPETTPAVIRIVRATSPAFPLLAIIAFPGATL